MPKTNPVGATPVRSAARPLKATPGKRQITKVDDFAAVNAKRVEKLAKQPDVVVLKTADGDKEFCLDIVCIDPRLWSEPVKKESKSNKDEKSADSKKEQENESGVSAAFMEVVQRNIYEKMDISIGSKCKIPLTNKKKVDISQVIKSDSDSSLVSFSTAAAMRNKYFELTNMRGRGLRFDVISGLIMKIEHQNQQV